MNTYSTSSNVGRRTPSDSLSPTAGKGTQVRRVGLTVAVLVAALSHTANIAAQGLPAGGYYADGAYYVPNDPPASATAQAPTDRPSACPVGNGVPTVYVASTATMIRIYQFWPAGGGEAPGFPYVPVYAAQAEC